MPINNTHRLIAYLDYQHDLSAYLKSPPSTEDSREYIKSIATDPYATWHDIVCDGKLAGFYIIGTAPNCNPSCDYYIQDFYVSPKYRRQGLGTATIEGFVREHKGEYCLFILNKNKAGQAFWSKLTESIGATLEVLDDEYNNNKNEMAQYYFVSR